MSNKSERESDAVNLPERAAGRTPEERTPSEKKKAAVESTAETVSEPGGFANDPDDPTNPNEVRERHLKKLRP